MEQKNENISEKPIDVSKLSDKELYKILEGIECKTPMFSVMLEAIQRVLMAKIVQDDYDSY